MYQRCGTCTVWLVASAVQPSRPRSATRARTGPRTVNVARDAEFRRVLHRHQAEAVTQVKVERDLGVWCVRDDVDEQVSIVEADIDVVVVGELAACFAHTARGRGAVAGCCFGGRVGLPGPSGWGVTVVTASNPPPVSRSIVTGVVGSAVRPCRCTVWRTGTGPVGSGSSVTRRTWTTPTISVWIAQMIG